MDIEIHQIHVGLEKSRQLLWGIRIDDQETSPAACQVIPSLDVFRVITACVMHLDNAPGYLFAGRVRVPFKATIPLHMLPPLFFSIRTISCGCPVYYLDAEIL